MVRFGPDVEWLHENIQPDEIDYTVNNDRAQLVFYNLIRQYWPDLPDGVLVPDYAGVRPKLNHPSITNSEMTRKEQDFIIMGPQEHGVPGVVHLLGIESPGLTSSMAMAHYVVSEILGGS
jgi:L-2-hydroxyglutarate oxidase LhgO